VICYITRYIYTCSYRCYSLPVTHSAGRTVITGHTHGLFPFLRFTCYLTGYIVVDDLHYDTRCYTRYTPLHTFTLQLLPSYHHLTHCRTRLFDTTHWTPFCRLPLRFTFPRSLGCCSHTFGYIYITLLPTHYLPHSAVTLYTHHTVTLPVGYFTLPFTHSGLLVGPICYGIYIYLHCTTPHTAYIYFYHLHFVPIYHGYLYLFPATLPTDAPHHSTDYTGP